MASEVLMLNLGHIRQLSLAWLVADLGVIIGQCVSQLCYISLPCEELDTQEYLMRNCSLHVCHSFKVA